MTVTWFLFGVFVAVGLKVLITNEVRERRNRKYRRDSLVFYDRQKTK
jgi:hypothetical protein